RLVSLLHTGSSGTNHSTSPDSRRDRSGGFVREEQRLCTSGKLEQVAQVSRHGAGTWGMVCEAASGPCYDATPFCELAIFPPDCLVCSVDICPLAAKADGGKTLPKGFGSLKTRRDYHITLVV